jgi:RNA polymerase sigma factor (sigma-70 family)
MGSLAKNSFVDAGGSPFGNRVQDVLHDLLPRLVRQFPLLNDDLLATEVMEEAGRRIVNREGQRGAVDDLHAFAWVTLRNVARSRMHRGSMRLERASLPPEQSRAALALVPCEAASPERVERELLLDQLFAQLPMEERMLFILKRAGFSSREIAKRRRSSVAAVDTMISRAKEKLRRFINGDHSALSTYRTLARAAKR